MNTGHFFQCIGITENEIPATKIIRHNFTQVYIHLLGILIHKASTCLLYTSDVYKRQGLNKPIHFTDCEASVRDIVNITAVAVIDAIVDKKKKEK